MKMFRAYIESVNINSNIYFLKGDATDELIYILDCYSPLFEGDSAGVETVTIVESMYEKYKNDKDELKRAFNTCIELGNEYKKDKIYMSCSIEKNNIYNGDEYRWSKI